MALTLLREWGRSLPITFVGSVLALLFCALGLYFYWTVLDTHPPRYYTDAIVHDGASVEWGKIHTKKRFEAGQTLHFIREVCVHKDAEGFVYYDLVNWDTSVVTSLAGERIKQRDVGCHKDNRSIVLPPQLEPGHYLLRQRSIYQVNPLREATVFAPTIWFEIVAGADHNN